MNVNDVRNMNLDQWVFWATALLLTFIIITLCLLWAGELENVWRSFKNFSPRGRIRRQGYTEIADPYAIRGSGAMPLRAPIRRREVVDAYGRSAVIEAPAQTSYLVSDGYRGSPLYGRRRENTYVEGRYND